MPVIVEAVEPGTAVQIWPRVSGMIDAGLSVCDEVMPDDILDRIASGKMLLWVAIAGLLFGLALASDLEDLLRTSRNSLHWHKASGDIVMKGSKILQN